MTSALSRATFPLQVNSVKEKVVVDDFDTKALYHTLRQFNCEKKYYLTMYSLLSAAKEKGVFRGEVHDLVECYGNVDRIS